MKSLASKFLIAVILTSACLTTYAADVSTKAAAPGLLPGLHRPTTPLSTGSAAVVSRIPPKDRAAFSKMSPKQKQAFMRQLNRQGLLLSPTT